jgi:hypothetical protein
MMEVLNDIPFSLNTAELMAQAHIEVGSSDATEFLSLVEQANSVGSPKAAYAVSYLESRNIDGVRIDGVDLTSRMLARNLESVERVFPLVATCGHELDQEFSSGGDMLKDFWWDLIKASLLSAASKFLDEHLHRNFRLGKTAIMRPGSGDAAVWPIEQQRALFALLGDVENSIGVKLTDSCLMVPNKTTSGILFPTEKDFRTCEVCHREDCPSRSAGFNEELWEAIQHN